MKPVTSFETAKKSTAPSFKTQPKISSRTGTKKRKAVFTKPKKTARIDSSTNLFYDGTGKIRGTKENVCDCFDIDCAGCHFECEICQSQKCGNVCRRFRKFAFEAIEYDGKDKIEKNKNIQSDPSKDW